MRWGLLDTSSSSCSCVSMMQYPASPLPVPPYPPQYSSQGGFLGGPMSSPAPTRASASVPITTGSTPEVTVARISVSSPTWFSRCDPTETRPGQKAERARSPHEGKAEEPREGTVVAKPEAATIPMTNVPTPTATPLSTGQGASPSGTSMNIPPEEARAL